MKSPIAPGIRTWAVVATLVLAGAMLLPGLERKALDGDEGTYAAVSLESARARSWLPLLLHDQPFVNKPPLALWFQRLSFELAPPSETSARITSALAGIVLCGLLGAWIARICGAAIGLVAAALLVTAPGLLGGAGWHGFRSATTDSLLSLLVAISAIAYLRFRSSARWPDLALAAAALAAATWTKGLAAALFVLPVALLVGIASGALRDSTSRRRAVREWSLLLAACLVPFVLWLLLVEAWLPGQSVARLLERDIWRRSTSGLNPTHLRGPAFYFLQLIRDFGWLLPLALVAIARTPRLPKPSALPRIGLGAWAVAPLLLASVASSKMPWYLFPSYPAWGGLIALGISDLLTLTNRRSRALAVALAATIAVIFGFRFEAALAARSRTGAPSAMRTLATELESRSAARVRVDPALRFGEQGLTGGGYFYFQLFAPPEAPGKPAEQGGCEALITQVARSTVVDPDTAGRTAVLVRPRFGETEVRLVDHCDGELASALRSALPGSELSGATDPKGGTGGS